MSSGTNSPARLDSQKQSQRLARLTGLFFILTFATSIPPFVWFYVPALSDPAFVLGGGFDLGVSFGALLELLLIVFNIGTALALYPVLRKQSEVLSLGYVAARLTECGFIAVGIIALMALNTLRLHAGEATRRHCWLPASRWWRSTIGRSGSGPASSSVSATASCWAS